MLNENYYRFNLGEFECIAFSDGSFNYQLEHFFVNAPQEQVKAALSESGLPIDHVMTPYTCLYVNTGSHRVLIDVGMGNLVPSAGKLLGNMKAIGLEPADIDTIIITHAHPDHIGGNLDEAGKPLYPNAAYTIWKAEWEFWSQGTASERVPQMFFEVARKNLTPIENRLTRLDQEKEIVPGVTALAAPGHTPGHMAVLVSSGDQSLLHVSDTVLYPLHLEHPDWLPIYDIQPERAAVSKQRIFDRAAKEKALVFAHHFPPFPNLGYVSKRYTGWQWQPIGTSA